MTAPGFAPRVDAVSVRLATSTPRASGKEDKMKTDKKDVPDVDETRRQALVVLAGWTPTVQRRDISPTALVVAAAAQLYLAAKYLEEAIKDTEQSALEQLIDVARFGELLELLTTFGRTLGETVHREAVKEAERVRSDVGVN